MTDEAPDDDGRLMRMMNGLIESGRRLAEAPGDDDGWRITGRVRFYHETVVDQIGGWSAEALQPASDPNWIAEYLAYHGDGCPAYRDAFDFEAGHGAAA